MTMPVKRARQNTAKPKAIRRNRAKPATSTPRAISMAKKAAKDTKGTLAGDIIRARRAASGLCHVPSRRRTQRRSLARVAAAMGEHPGWHGRRPSFGHRAAEHFGGPGRGPGSIGRGHAFARHHGHRGQYAFRGHHGHRGQYAFRGHHGHRGPYGHHGHHGHYAYRGDRRFHGPQGPHAPSAHSTAMGLEATATGTWPGLTRAHILGSDLTINAVRMKDAAPAWAKVGHSMGDPRADRRDPLMANAGATVARGRRISRIIVARMLARTATSGISARGGCTIVAPTATLKMVTTTGRGTSRLPGVKGTRTRRIHRAVPITDAARHPESNLA